MKFLFYFMLLVSVIFASFVHLMPVVPDSKTLNGNIGESVRDVKEL